MEISEPIPVTKVSPILTTSPMLAILIIPSSVRISAPPDNSVIKPSLFAAMSRNPSFDWTKNKTSIQRCVSYQGRIQDKNVNDFTNY